MLKIFIKNYIYYIFENYNINLVENIKWVNKLFHNNIVYKVENKIKK